MPCKAPHNNLIIALDVPSKDEAPTLAHALCGHVRWVKVGLELFCRTGPSLISLLKEMGFKVFLDLKFMDIPNTVKGAAASACAAGADMLTIHLMGGEAMAKAALEGVRKSGKHRPLVLGVTILTSTSPDDLAWMFHEPKHLSATVLALARKAKSVGLDGIVCSGQEVQKIRKHIHDPFVIVTPGIRLANEDEPDDQKRVTTPEAALCAGSDYLVVGRPVTRSSDPVHAVQCFLDAMKERI